MMQTEGMQLERARKAGSKFLNPVETGIGGFSTMLKVLPLYLKNKEETEPRRPLGPFRTDAAAYARAPETGLRITWFGHSSELVEIDGVRLLLDPVWDERAAPVSWLGPRRFFAPTLRLEELPPVDAVLISHDHYDHLGRETVKRLAKLRPGMRWICPLGVAKLLRNFGVAEGRVTELDWTQETVVRGCELGAEVSVTALPTRHFSGRAPWNRFETLWTSYALQGSKHKVYFGADSGLWEGFEAIGKQFGPFDLTLLEIGAFNQLWHQIHLGPEGAAKAFELLGGGVLMPIHWGLFNLALHAWRQPIERMEELARERGVTMFVPEPGQPTEVCRGEAVRSVWWKLPG
jgi:L-ascorbate metabolism protein UlaG (beta-lactamase superfamily)